MSNTVDIPPGLWLRLWGDQMQEERVHDGIREYIRMYYREYVAAVEVEPDVVNLLERLFDAISITGTSIEDIIREVEAELNENGGVYNEWESKYHKVATYEPEEDE